MSKFYESDYEEALIDLLHEQGWEYTHGGNIHRNNREVLIDRQKTILKTRSTIHAKKEEETEDTTEE